MPSSASRSETSPSVAARLLLVVVRAVAAAVRQAVVPFLAANVVVADLTRPDGRSPAAAATT